MGYPNSWMVDKGKSHWNGWFLLGNLHLGLHRASKVISPHFEAGSSRLTSISYHKTTRNDQNKWYLQLQEQFWIWTSLPKIVIIISMYIYIYVFQNTEKPIAVRNVMLNLLLLYTIMRIYHLYAIYHYYEPIVLPIIPHLLVGQPCLCLVHTPSGCQSYKLLLVRASLLA